MSEIQNLTVAGHIIAGLLLLFLGRKLFWLFVGVAGFLLGAEFGSQLVPGAEQLTVLLISLAVGLVGALLAIFLQKIAIILAGAAAGGLFVMQIVADSGLAAPLPMIGFIVGAIIAAIFVGMVFEWALIILSAITGASLLVLHIPIGTDVRWIAWIVLAIAGIIVQARLNARANPA